ncbi:hypothetical protein HO133_010688 [Letharia lupina]|uniref:Allergen Asp f 7 n=1 Tax=Letharia lupina TaxID=560253 RepID=A0A8H6CII9_9LECA|nr:uncharacterized protein HO133_010688 [Letharia lupina]KAF6224114.1 hypothetical protein HO133_010688 [Letharia lupina]
MKLSTTLAFGALLALSSAMPLERRQDITITTTVDVIETVDVIVTVWLPPGRQPADQDQHQQAAQPNIPNPAPVVHITPVQDATIPAQTPPPAAQQNPNAAAQNQANQAQEQTNHAQAAKNQAAQDQSIHAQDLANQAQEQANDNKAAQNQAAQQQAAPAPKSPPPAVPANSPAAAPAKSPAIPPATQDNTSSDQTQPTSGGSCGENGGTCTATNVTYFGGGLGACGWSNDTTSEDFFALAHDMMGLQSNGNPFCGRTAAIVYQGKTIHGTLTDKCMGCGLQSIDLSQHLYDQMFVESVGNYHDVEWHFTS